ncbi:hypothetical protein [Clostridium vitabionis]|jgi:hypothetical protein|uniref:hypothetical protein n=1 Tax=Clostridium vitabionis TaxID=2784388 RepID=UPI00188C8A9A|nr:hypothetical protein [Clostridium vitabionis]
MEQAFSQDLHPMHFDSSLAIRFICDTSLTDTAVFLPMHRIFPAPAAAIARPAADFRMRMFTVPLR